MIDIKKELAKHLNVYIKEKHTQEECKGFIDGFEKAAEIINNINLNDIIEYIENNAEIAMPIDALFNEDGTNITKKQYGKVLLKFLVIELREKFNNLP